MQPDRPLEVLSFPNPPLSEPPHWLILLHGWGANATDLRPLAPQLLPQGQGLMPNAPFPHPMVPGGRMWYDLTFQEDGTVRDPNLAPETSEMTGATIDESCRLLEEWFTTQNMDLSRTILAGFSQGGVMTLEVGLKYPFAGLVVFSGYWLRSHPIEQRTEQKSPPILMIHGNQDPVIPVQSAQHSCDRLRQAGLNCAYQEFTMGHGINDSAIALAQQFIQHCLDPG